MPWWTVESPSRADGLSAFGVRCAVAAVVVDVQQTRRKDVTRAVDNIRAVPSELTPTTAGPCGEDATVSEGHEGGGAVEP